MSLPNYLAKIKSSGTYRFVFDLSEIPSEERSTLRLVPGYSERGQFNTPVYIETAEEFINTFGNISRRMERKGIYFHRMALQALEKGPILALNLKPFKDETTKFVSFNASDIAAPGSATAIAAAEKAVKDAEEALSKANDSGKEAAQKKVDDAKTALYNLQTPHKFELYNAVVANTSTFNAKSPITSIYDTNRFWKIVDNIHDITAAGNNVTTPEDYIRIVQTGSKEDSVTLFVRPWIPSGYDIKIADWYANETNEEMPSYMEPIRDHMLSEFFAEIYVFKGKLNEAALFSKSGTLGSLNTEGNWQPFCNVDADGTLTSNPEYTNIFGDKADALAAMADVSTSNFVNVYQGILFPNFRNGTGSLISLDAQFNADYSAHKCIMGFNESVLDDAYEADSNFNGAYDSDEDISGLPVVDTTVSGLVHQLCSAVHFGSAVSNDDSWETRTPAVNMKTYGYYLQGYDYTTIQKNAKGEPMQKAILNVLNYKGIYEALSNNVDSDWKYWIDTFQSYPGPAIKAQVAAIAKKKFNCLAILNFPPIKECAIQIGYPGIQGGFDMQKIVSTSSGITLPSDDQGASWCAYYTQLQFSDGSNKFLVPSAALVSNLFIDKLNNRHKYDVVAGPNYGRITYQGLVGPEYNFARADLDALEPFGVNAIVYIPRKGNLINSNQTAKQVPVNALSKVNVRELVTFLQDELEEMLYGYQWELNTSTLRDKIATKARQILELCQANGGIYAFDVKCDESNNPPEVIDNEMVIVQVDIEPGRGAGKMVQILRLHRTGGLSAS